jgi:hypothetical protein
LLSNSVSRTELANRFGIAFRHLKAEAQAFYQLAVELAEPGSAEYQNALSNLGTLIGDTDSLGKALAAQEHSGDLGNMVTSGANLLRAAARNGTEASQSSIDLLKDAASRLPFTEAQFSGKCNVLGALSVYYAGHRMSTEALACVREIGGMLVGAAAHRKVGLGSAVLHLRELFQLHVEREDNWRVCEVGPVVAGYLQNADLEDEEVRARLVTASFAGPLYNRTGNQKYLKMLLEESARVGRIFRRSAALEAELITWAPTLRENTLRVWQKVQEQGPLELALLAYEAQLAWPGGESMDAWEQVRAAHSEANLNAVFSMAKSGHLKRSIRVTIDNDLHETVSVLINHSASSGRALIFCTWPVDSNPAAQLKEDGIVRVCGVAVIKVRAGDRMELRENSGGHLYRGNDKDYFYADSWGSGVFDYDLDIELPPRFIPLHIELTRSKVAMTSGLRFDAHGCTVRVCPVARGDGEVSPWSARVVLLFREVGPEGALFSQPGSPFLEWTAFDRWESLLAQVRSEV